MNRHYTEHDFPDAMRLPVHAVTIYCRSDAERKAVIAAAQRVPVAPAFVPTPFGYAGEPQDPPEHFLQAVSAEYAPEAVGVEIAQRMHDEAEATGDACGSTGCVVVRDEP